MTTDSISNSDGYDEPTDSPNRVTTTEARDRLEETLFSALQAGENTLIDAPTSLGKSHKIAKTPWLQYPEITGGDLVVHIHQTRDARDEAVKKSRATDGLTLRVLKGREDVCPTAAGDYDDELTAPNGLSPSEWFEHMCDVRKNGFYTAHLKLERHFDGNIPCAEDGPCQSLKQWWQDLRDDDGNPTVDIVHTTANFAHVEGLIEGANLVFDERPEYAVNLGDSGRQQIRDSLANLVYYRSDGQYSISDIVSANLRDDDEMKLKLRSLLDEEISKDWYFRREETHRLAPEIGLAMLNAEEIIRDRWAGEDVNFCGRRMGKYQGINVVMNSKGKLRHVHYSPDLSMARCVIGLDAFPSEYRWELNTVGDLIRTDVLESTERQVWRREERGLEIVQIGTNTRAYTRRWKGAGKERADGLIRALRQRHGEEFRTCITPGSIEDDIRRFMRDADMEVPPPIDGKPVEPTMHYGEQNSRNDFERESVGLLVGCIDPGDENILDLLALGRECAWPETTTTEDGEKVRKPDRSYLGEATDTAYDILQSVREANIAQGVGRYARSPGSSESSALVYVWSDACPAMLVDETIEASYHSITKARRNMINCLRSGSSTASEIEEETGSDRSYIHDCLKSFRECGLVTVSEGSGKDGADEWEWIGPGLTADLPEVLVEVDF